ncbi:MAG: rhomboid family intramembrane serine protease [Chlorobi bacterium]|nr:rhomboid family intramembrane serine protease [Chlorobiota bacterium]
MNNTKNEIIETFKRGSMLTKLIYINVAAFVIFFFVFLFLPYNAKNDFLAVPGDFHRLIYRPWTLVTYMFTHEGFTHLLFNMLWLYWFGKMFLTYFYEKQLSAVYLLGGFSGALLHLLVGSILPNSHVGIIGSSAAVMSVVFAVVAFRPDYIINLLFIGPVKIKYIAIVAFIIDLMGLAGNLRTGGAATDGIAHIAHMGGSFFGLWFGYSMRNGKDITRSFNNFLNSFFSWFTTTKTDKNRARMRATRGERFTKPKSDWEYTQEKHKIQEEVDRILDKIKATGYDSLTKKEKDFLFKQKR